MDKPVSAANANRNFSKLLRSVQDGRSYVVTSHGKPVAKLVPVGKHGEVTTRARTALLRRLRSQPATNAGRWTRDELYED